MFLLQIWNLSTIGFHDSVWIEWFSLLIRRGKVKVLWWLVCKSHQCVKSKGQSHHGRGCFCKYLYSMLMVYGNNKAVIVFVSFFVFCLRSLSLSLMSNLPLFINTQVYILGGPVHSCLCPVFVSVCVFDFTFVFVFVCFWSLASASVCTQWPRLSLLHSCERCTQALQNCFD